MRTSKAVVGVGVVGIGRVGKQHAINLLQLIPRAKLLCVCSPAPADLAWANEHLKPHGVQVFATFEDMIETRGLEAIVVASTTALHQGHTIAAFQRGIHVLCEKPLCTSAEELNSVIRLFDTKPEVRLMVAFVRRFDDSYRDAHAKIQQGLIGRPIVLRFQSCEKLDMSSSYKQYLRNSGGIFVDAGIHDIDLALFLFGEDSRPKSVSAVGVSAAHTELVEQGDADNAVGTCEFWDGRIAFFYVSRSAAHGYDNASEIFGTAGKVSVNLVPHRTRVQLCDGDGLVKTDALPGWYDRYRDSFVAEVLAWIDAILDHQPMPVPLRSSLASLAIASALQESLRTGRKIEFSESTGRPN